MNRFLRIAVAFDQLANTLCGGWEDETISSRSYRMGQVSQNWEKARKVIDAIFGDNHCKNSFEYERHRLGQPPELR
jgi:hypothetical protein